MPRRNVIVQPQNRGTAIGLLLPLLHIARRDPHARVVILPSDHYVRDEAVLARALRRAVTRLANDAENLWLLGIAPEEADPERDGGEDADGFAPRGNRRHARPAQ